MRELAVVGVKELRGGGGHAARIVVCRRCLGHAASIEYCMITVT
jgi:hypothetical protein